MARKTTTWAVAGLVVASVGVVVWFGRTPTGPGEKLALPGSILSDAQMQDVRGGRDIITEYQ